MAVQLAPLKVTHIVAMADNRVIGRAGGLPWHIPEDFRFFKATTSGHALIMGRKTFESIGRPLPGRLSIVVTRQPALLQAAQAREDAPVVPVGSVAEGLAYAETQRDRWGDEVFVIGGGELYRETLAIAGRVYLTRVHQSVDGDTHYPELPASDFDVVDERQGSGDVAVTFTTLERRRR